MTPKIWFQFFSWSRCESRMKWLKTNSSCVGCSIPQKGSNNEQTKFHWKYQNFERFLTSTHTVWLIHTMTHWHKHACHNKQRSVEKVCLMLCGEKSECSYDEVKSTISMCSYIDGHVHSEQQAKLFWPDNMYWPLLLLKWCFDK